VPPPGAQSPAAGAPCNAVREKIESDTPARNDERRPVGGGGSSSSLARQVQATHADPVDADDALALFSVRRTPAPPDIPPRVDFVLRDLDDEHVRGPGVRPTTGSQDARAPLWWTAEAERIVLALVDSGHSITSDDLRERYPDEPSATGAAIGALFKRMSNKGLLQLVGHCPSTRPEARGRVVGIWRRP
jgi:hypothetical protein